MCLRLPLAHFSCTACVVSCGYQPRYFRVIALFTRSFRATTPSSSDAPLPPPIDSTPQQEGIVATQDVAPETYQAAPVPTVMEFYRDIASIPSDADLTTLSRSVQVGSFAWPTTAAQNTLLTTINFPDALFAVPFIASRLAYFRHFRAGVAVTFRMSTNQFLYGCLMASWDSATSLDSSSSSDADLGCSSGFPHVLLQANDSVTQQIVVPFLYPQPYLDTQTWRSGDIGSVDITVVAPLRASTPVSVSTLTVDVWASFVDPELVTPTTTTLATCATAPVSRGGRPVLSRK